MNTLEVKIGDGAYVSVNVPLVNVVNANVPVGSKSNFVSYVEEQNKTEEEKARARQNIGITDDLFNQIDDNNEDFTVMGVNVGNIKDGDTFIASETNAWNILKQMLTKVIDVIAHKPTITLSSSIAASNRKVELGTTIEQTLSISYSDGYFSGNSGYNYNLSAGCAQGATVFKQGNDTINASHDFTFTSVGNYTFSAFTEYGGSTNTPKKNDNSNSSVSISSGTATASITYNVCKKYFYGNVGSALTDSAAIRSTLNEDWCDFSGTKDITIANIGTGVMLVYPKNKQITYAITGNNQPWKNAALDEFTYYDVTMIYEDQRTEQYTAAIVIPATPMATNVTITIG